MTIHAVFEHKEGGYRFAEVFNTKGQFLRSLKSDKYEFINGMDTVRATTIYPSTLPDYRRME